MNQDPTDDISALAAIALTMADPVKVKEDDSFVIVPDGYRLQDLEAFLERPRRTKQHVIVDSVDSFRAYWERFSSDESAIFIDRNAPKATAILDYHDPDVAGWTGHRLTLTIQESDQWKTWMSLNEKGQTQVKFAWFLEENLLDIIEPESAHILEVVRDLQIQKNVTFGSAVHDQSGDVRFMFETETHSKGQLEIPEHFRIAIPVFNGGQSYELTARLRYSVSDEGKLSLWYSILRPKNAREIALEAVFADIRLLTENSYSGAAPA